MVRRKKLVALTLGMALGVSLLYTGAGMKEVSAAELPEACGWVVEQSGDETSAQADTGIADGVVKEETSTAESDAIGIDEMSVGLAYKTVYGTQDYAAAYQVLSIVNQRRAEYGLSPLTMDRDLLDAAMLRAAEITVSFSHTRPCGESCFTVSNKVFGENIAYGYGSAESVMTGWMNSEGHRNNILGGYSTIGIGCFVYNGTRYWTQLFGIGSATSVTQPANKNVYVDVLTDSSDMDDYTLEAREIDVKESDPRTGFTAYFRTNAPDISDIEYSWYASNDDGKSWITIADWTAGLNGIEGVPDRFGDYVIVAKARKIGDDSTTVASSFQYSYHPAIKGKCQMPYTGQGGGYLIGVETYDNPNQSYRYELLILDCTLLAQGKDAWIWSTGKYKVPEKCFWAVWQPEYGYYWTLFRVYDKSGTLIDQECYGFVNAY